MQLADLPHHEAEDHTEQPRDEGAGDERADRAEPAALGPLERGRERQHQDRHLEGRQPQPEEDPRALVAGEQLRRRLEEDDGEDDGDAYPAPSGSRKVRAS
jgi:hypothetical protein